MRAKKEFLIIIATFLITAVIVSILIMTSRVSKGELKSIEENFTETESGMEPETIETIDLMEMADMIVYTYDELKECADAIVKVKIKDKLTKENSVYKEAEPNAYNKNQDMGWCYSLREAEVLEVYSGAEDWKIGDTKKIQDACAIIPEGEQWFLYIFDGYEPPEKGTTYLLFLENETKSGEPAIINYGNGSINLDEPEKNQYPDIANAAIQEFVE